MVICFKQQRLSLTSIPGVVSCALVITILFWNVPYAIGAQPGRNSIGERSALNTSAQTTETSGTATLGSDLDLTSRVCLGTDEVDDGEEESKSVGVESNFSNSSRDIEKGKAQIDIEKDGSENRESASGDGYENIDSWLLSEKGILGRKNISTSAKTLIFMSFFSLAPALLLMTTSYVRISVVLGLLRQAIGAGQIPSNQVMAALALFLTILIMFPVWSDVYQDAIDPYSKGLVSNQEAIHRGEEPIKKFLWGQIEKTGNMEMIEVFAKYVPVEDEIDGYQTAPWRALLPAFLVSELRVAFLIGFQIFLPFLIIDVIVSCVLASSGMVMLPPTIVSLPFKLILFVLADGWALVVKSLLESFSLE